MQNIFKLQEKISKEIFEEIANGSSFRMERIISPHMPNGASKWYEQEEHELVILLQGVAKIEYENSDIITLKQGDYITIKPMNKHRVYYTSKEPLAIWLTIHYKN